MRLSCGKRSARGLKSFDQAIKFRVSAKRILLTPGPLSELIGVDPIKIRPQARQRPKGRIGNTNRETAMTLTRYFLGATAALALGTVAAVADPAIIFDTPVEQRYDRAVSLLGFDPGMLSQEAGHS